MSFHYVHSFITGLDNHSKFGIAVVAAAGIFLVFAGNLVLVNLAAPQDVEENAVRQLAKMSEAISNKQ